MGLGGENGWTWIRIYKKFAYALVFLRKYYRLNLISSWRNVIFTREVVRLFWGQNSILFQAKSKIFIQDKFSRKLGG